MKKTVIAITITILFLITGVYSATSSENVTTEQKEPVKNLTVKICPFARIELNSDSTISITTYVLRFPIFTLKELFPPTKCFILGFTDIELVTGTLTVKPLIEPDIVLKPGDTVAITGFVGKGEAISGETWRSDQFCSLSGIGRNVILNLH